MRFNFRLVGFLFLFIAGCRTDGLPSSDGGAGPGADGGGTGGGSGSCAGRPAATCKDKSGCTAAFGCSACDGNPSPYIGCYENGTQPISNCPAVECDDCTEATTEAACNALTMCHAVYRDPGTCLCAQPGCCQQFERCGAGKKANCSMPTAVCDIVPPTCDGPYVLAYTNSCYEGCVLQTACQ